MSGDLEFEAILFRVPQFPQSCKQNPFGHGDQMAVGLKSFRTETADRQDQRDGQMNWMATTKCEVRIIPWSLVVDADGTGQICLAS